MPATRFPRLSHRLSPSRPPFLLARGAPPPLALTRRPGFAGLPSGASLGPQALYHCSRGPTSSIAPGPHPGALGSRLSLALTWRPGFAGLPSGGPPQRLARAAGAFLCSRGPTTESLEDAVFHVEEFLRVFLDIDDEHPEIGDRPIHVLIQLPIFQQLSGSPLAVVHPGHQLIEPIRH